MTLFYYCSNCGHNVGWKEEIFSFFGKFKGWKEICFDKFCKNCGTSTETAYTKKCLNGHPLMYYDKFCDKCGAIPRVPMTPEAKAANDAENANG